MGFLKHFRSKSRLKEEQVRAAAAARQLPPEYIYHGADQTQRLPKKVLRNIFSYVCPHVLDQTYEACEQSQIGDGCMLCDLRDLAHCAQACRKWHSVAQDLLYGSVRIDAVHYCELEEILGEKRKKAGKGLRGRGAIEPGEVPNIRLALLCQTVRGHPTLGAQTLFFKVPYMTRETAKGDLARTVAAMPNLRYVDLPDGFYSGDPNCLALRQELQARCPELRKMTYRNGSEEALELLARGHWQAIEILDLSALAIEPATLRIVLAALPTLHELTLIDMPWLDDVCFQSAPQQLPDFPALQSLRLVNIPNVTAQGIVSWLQPPHVREALASLTIENTGINVPDLHMILWAAPALHHLSYTEVVSKSLSINTSQIPPLASISLQTMHFEITSSEEVHGLLKPAESYYAYLASSLHQNCLPALSTLYVRDQNFAEMLILPPIPTPFGGSDAGSLKSKPSNVSSQSSARSALNGGGFNQTLEVFSKGIDELEWVFTSIQPPTAKNRSGSVSGGRPLSQYSASRGLGPQWAQAGFGGEVRQSVVVGNGFGGFLAVPQEEVPRPMTAEGNGRWGSIGSLGTGGSAGSHRSSLRPPPSLAGSAASHGRKGSRADLWR